MDSKTIAVIIGDLHIGSNTALATPEFELHTRNRQEIQIAKANEMQQWLWECWLEFWEYVDELLGDKNRLVIVILGDTLEGVHHNSPQLITEHADQFRLALDILQPHIDRADKSYGVLGTATHSGIAAEHESTLYQALGLTDYGYRIVLDIDGLVHDFAHHGRAGRRPWTSAAVGFGTEISMDYISQGLQSPNYIWRGHNHLIDDSGFKLPNTRVLCTPSWQLKTDYSYKVAAAIRSDIGGFIMNGVQLDSTRARYYGQPDGIRIIRV